MNDFFLLNFFLVNANNFQVLDSKIFKFLAINIFRILSILTIGHGALHPQGLTPVEKYLYTPDLFKFLAINIFQSFVFYLDN